MSATLVRLLALDPVTGRLVVAEACRRAHLRVHGVPMPGEGPYRPLRRAPFSVCAPVPPMEGESFGA